MADEHANDERGEGLSLERIVFFSDAVIAIAITLLAIQIRLPEMAGEGGESLIRALRDLWPRYLSFGISFLIIGTYWWIHHRAFRALRRYDKTLIWLNLLFLLCIVFLPFASSVLGEHGDDPGAATFYALCVAATGFAEAILYSYASWGHRLIDKSLPERAIQHARLRALVTPTVFLLSIPVAWWHTRAAMLCWIATFAINHVLRQIEHRAWREAPVTPGVAVRVLLPRQAVTSRKNAATASRYGS